MSEILEILRVCEKNCYPGKNGSCVHVCTVKMSLKSEKRNEIKDILLNSDDIIDINKTKGHSTSVHFEDVPIEVPMHFNDVTLSEVIPQNIQNDPQDLQNTLQESTMD